MIEIQHSRLLGTLVVRPPTRKAPQPMTDEEAERARQWLHAYWADRRRRGIPAEGVLFEGERRGVARRRGADHEGHEVTITESGRRWCRTCKQERRNSKMGVDKRVADHAGAWLARNDCQFNRDPAHRALVTAVQAMLQHGEYGILAAVLDEFDAAGRRNLAAAEQERELHERTCGCGNPDAQV